MKTKIFPNDFSQNEHIYDTYLSIVVFHIYINICYYTFAGKKNEKRVWKIGQDGDEHLGML